MRRIGLSLGSVAMTAILSGASLAYADSAPAPTTPAKGASSDGAITFGLLYTGELWDNLSGGVKTGADYVNQLDAKVSIDAGKAFGWTGGLFYFEAFGVSRQSPTNTLVQSVQEVSPLDTAQNVQIFRLYQAYYDQPFGATDVRFGVYDLASEFASEKAAEIFLNKNFGWNSTLDQSGTLSAEGQVGPSTYPFTSLAARVIENFGSQFQVKLAIANAALDNPNNPQNNTILFSKTYGAMVIGEADYEPVKFSKIMVGAWYLTGQFPVYSATPNLTSWGDAGVYVGGQYRLLSPSKGRGLDVFLNAGLATPKVTDTSASINGGFSYTGLFDARPTDKIGLSMATNFASSNARNASAATGVPLTSTEVVFEATYRARINEYLTVQPDLQYIVNPGFSTTAKNDLIVGLHFEVGKDWTW